MAEPKEDDFLDDIEDAASEEAEAVSYTHLTLPTRLLV